MNIRKFCCLLITVISILGMLMGGYIKASEQGPMLEATSKLRAVIRTKAEEIVVHYQRESFWEETEFSEILKDKHGFETIQFGEFSAQLSEYSLEGSGYAFEFDQTKKSTVLRCDVYGAISKRDDSYYGKFGWLIRPLELDFINSNFKESKMGLSWEGTISDIPTTINCEFLPQDVVYEAWSHPVGHCHAHVWWTEVSTAIKPISWGKLKSLFSR